MDGAPPANCICGCENLERVVVMRPYGPPYRTDFLACAECRVMYFSPADREPTRSKPEGYGHGVGGPSR